MNFPNRNIWLGGIWVAIPLLLLGIGVGLFWEWLNPKGKDWHEAFAPSTLSNWALVIVGIGAIIAALRTLRTLSEQTLATKESADAAKLSAEALVNSERAWVIAELVPICVRFGGQWCRPAGDGWAQMIDEEILNGDHLKHKLKLTNMGRTAAHILRYQIEYSCLGAGVRRLSESPVRNQVSVRGFDYLLGGGGSVLPEAIDVNGYMGDLIGKITRLENTAVFHGWVQYQHVFSQTEIVKEPFAYVYRPSTLGLEKAPTPPPEYRKENEDTTPETT